MPPTAVNQALKRESASTANVLMCKQWWKVCWMYGDQEKYYRQLYGKPKSTMVDGNKELFCSKGPLGGNSTSAATQHFPKTPLESTVTPNNCSKPTNSYNTNSPDWAVQYYQNTRLLEDTSPLTIIPNVVPRQHGLSNTLGVPYSTNTSGGVSNSVSGKACALNRSFSFEEVRGVSPNGERCSPMLSSLDLTRGIVDE